MNEFEPLLKQEEEKLNLNSENQENFEKPTLKQETIKVEQSEIESPVDPSCFEKPTLKNEINNNELSTTNDENKEKIETSNIETKSVTLDELNNKSLEKTKEKSSKEEKTDIRTLVTTYIMGAITLFLITITTISFYYGFKYYDIAHRDLLPEKVQSNQ